MTGVKYIGPVLDASGYAEAARNYVLSIQRTGYPITVAPITFENVRPELGKEGGIIHSLINKNISYDKVIIHSTPDLWQHYMRSEQGKYFIGCTVWETSNIHPSWVVACNRANEVWVPCDWNVEVFRGSGVEVPIYKVPHAIEVPDPSTIPAFNLEGIEDQDYVFYSIFQWQERKNPYGLLAAYTAAFTGVKDVVLVMKTYQTHHSADKNSIRELVLQYKKYINLDHFPKMYLIVENLSREGVMALHRRGDCFVLLQRSEGWGLPHFEAAAMGNPVITPAYGGQTDFLKKDNSYLIDYQMTPVTGMPWSPYYRGDQWWCEPNIKRAVDTMRHVYTNREEALGKGKRSRQYVSDNFTLDRIGAMLMERLQQLDRE